jgi:hypothetical protein
LSGYSIEIPIPTNMSIPSGVSSGQYYIGVLVDSGQAIIEENENNNQQVQSFAVTQDKWTVMGYFDGDCDREAQALGNLGQMEQANQAGVPVNLVALVDRHPNTGPTGGYTNIKVPYNGSDWYDTRWGPVFYDGNQNSFATSMTPLNSGQPELNMADDATLTDYIHKMMQIAPAQHYALVIYNHGNMGGIARDDTSNDGGISIPELRAAMDAVSHIDIVVLDACLMQEIEVASEFIGEADYLMASQAERGGTSKGSYTYLNKSLQWLIKNSTATPSQFVQHVFDEDRHDVEFAGQQGDVSVLDLREMSELNQRVDTFAATAIQTATISELTGLQNARSGVEAFSPWKSYLDLRQYMAAVSGNSAFSSQLRAAAQDVVNQVDQLVIHEKGAGEGVSVFFPDKSDHVPSWYNGQNYHFLQTSHADGTRWLHFMLALPPFQTIWHAIDYDWGDFITEPWNIEADSLQPVSLEAAIEHLDDADFFKIATSSEQVLYAELYGDPCNSGLLPLLTVYDEDQDTVLAQTSPSEEGHVFVKGLILPGEGEYYLAVTSEGNDEPLDPREGDTLGQYSLSLIFGQAEDLTPELGLNSQSLFFGQVPINTWSSATLRLTNHGGTTLDVNELQLPNDSPFRAPAEAILLPISLSPGESFDLRIGVKPVQLGGSVDPLHIMSTEPENPDMEVTLEAIGVDCQVESLWPVSNAKAGQNVTLWARVKNCGLSSLPADTQVWFWGSGPDWSGSPWVGSADISGLSPGESQWYSFDWGVPACSQPWHVHLLGSSLGLGTSPFCLEHWPELCDCRRKQAGSGQPHQPSRGNNGIRSDLCVERSQ